MDVGARQGSRTLFTFVQCTGQPLLVIECAHAPLLLNLPSSDASVTIAVGARKCGARAAERGRMRP